MVRLNIYLLAPISIVLALTLSGCLDSGEAATKQDLTDTDKSEDSGEVLPPILHSLGDVPVVLTRAPRMDWAPPFDPDENRFLAVQIQVKKVADDSEVYPWTDFSPASTMLNGLNTTLSGLTLIDGESYLINLRSVDEDGNYSEIVSTPSWTAREGVGSWSTMSSVNAPAPRMFFASVWTGSKWIIWGGQDDNGLRNDGAIYDPATDTWTTMSTVNAPTGRNVSSAVWTGTEMIIWGGPTSSSWTNTGARYNLATNTWHSTATAGAPQGRVGHSAIWTGSRMIVWGGQSIVSGMRVFHNDGGIYNPSNNSWSSIASSGAPAARDQHSAVWTGTEMIIWGGMANNPYPNYQPVVGGGIYDPSTNSWSGTTIAGSSGNGFGYNVSVSLWTGLKMLVVGSLYDPSNNTWNDITPPSHPHDATEGLDLMASGQAFSAWGWTGSKLIKWGGFTGWATVNTGGIYDVATDSWTPTTLTGAPSPSRSASGVWTGSKLLVWGGVGSEFVHSSYTP